MYDILEKNKVWQQKILGNNFIFEFQNWTIRQKIKRKNSDFG